MKPKTDLNNTQRKMLDEIYTEQFKKKEQKILADRQEGYAKLCKKVLKQETKSKNVKAVLEAGEKFLSLVSKHREEFEEKGLKLTNLPYRDESKYELELVRDRWDATLHPELQAYKDETDEIEINLGQIKKEMRAKIYGLNTTYEEVDKEIAEILKGVKA